MLLKVCGLREQENVKSITALQPQWMGFIFSPSSPRYFDDAKQAVEINLLPKEIEKVGVFVNADEATVVTTYNRHQLDYVQLHGDESVEFCKGVSAKGINIIKAFGIHDEFDFSVLEQYTPYVSMFLFDTAGKLRGGGGVKFNHELLKGKRFGKSFLLSGGIGPGDVGALKNMQHPDLIGVDVNSKFEIEPGLKDVEALKIFKQQIA